jgi:Cu(I)/Ag(I) efflux system protein CusF
MKSTKVVFCSLVLSVVGAGFARADDMSGMDMKKPMPMAMEKKTDKMERMTYAGIGVVKSVDKAKGTVTLAHEPIAALSWPAMTMAFKVTDAMLFDKLNVGKKVEFTLTKQGADYVVTTVK